MPGVVSGTGDMAKNKTKSCLTGLEGFGQVVSMVYLVVLKRKVGEG